MAGRGQIINRGPDRWLVRVFLGRDPESGKRRYHNKTIHGPKKEAGRYLTKILRDLDSGTYVEQSRTTLGEFLEKWLETVAKPRVSERTLRDYRSSLERYILPTLGSRRLQALLPFEIQAVYAGMLERGLSARTVRAVHAPLRSALTKAVRWHLLSRNPAQLVDLPKAAPSRPTALTAEEATRFLAAARGDPLEALWALLLTTGLRPGEALGLKWTDINGNRISVVRALTRRADGGWALKEPKTPRSRRAVTAPDSTLGLLRSHRARQAEERLRVGEAYEDLDLVFATAKGSPLDLPNITRRSFKPITERAGIQRMRVYDLRHTCATLLLAAGEHPKVVSERLGHASVTLTLDTYSHVLPHMQEGAALKLEGMLFG